MTDTKNWKRVVDKKAVITAVVQTLGGEVEGHPTSSINYLQRIRAMKDEIERLRTALEGYACMGIEHCTEPKLKDGTCIRAGVGTCGDDAYQALKLT